MKNVLRSIVVAGALVCTLGLASQAQAAQIGIDPDGSAGATNSMVYSDLWTMMTDTGLSVGFVPGRSVPPNPTYPINFIYQGRVGTMQSGGASVTPTWLNNNTPGGYQLTKVTDILETVTFDTTYVNTNPGPGFGQTHEYATFASGANGSSMAIYLGALPPAANPNIVSDYQSGLHLFDVKLLNQTSSFDFNLTTGIGTGSFDTNWIIDMDSLFTQAAIAGGFLDVATNTVFGDHFTGTTNIPSFFDPTFMWNGTLTASGIPVTVDGSQSFIAAQIPEPSTFLLLGAGLAGLGLIRRNRKS